MTYKEAHTFLKVKQREMINNRYSYNEQAIEINDLVILALEKQIPKKPNCKKYTNDIKCPVCNTFVLIYNKYCIECGQALDWSDSE